MEYFPKIFSENKTKRDKELSSRAYHYCQFHVKNRELCWNRALGEHQQIDCFDEELAEKKCLASQLCPDIYNKFYTYTECHLWAAAFRKKDDIRYLDARNRIDKDPAMSRMCRDMGYELSNKMSQYSKYREEALEGESYLKKEGQN